jgi:hypothetical protein
MVIIEACSNSLLFKQSSVRIEALGLAIHEQMCSKILDNIDEIVVVLRFVPELPMPAIHFIINMRCEFLKPFR